jgi:Asp-tRNA(Asn)/Glu-tRNA(Gln) amidotransferase C subunit
VFSVLFGLTLAIAQLWPRTYHCESRFIAQPNLFAPRERQGIGDALSGAADVILRHESLDAIIKQTNLVKSWPATRAPLLKWKDGVMAWLRGPLTDEIIRKMLVGTLETKLFVTTTGNAATITIDWQDPHVAAELVNAAEQNFLESRHVAEISTIAEYISILEAHAVKVRDEIYKISEQLQKLREDRRANAERRLAEKRAALDVKEPAPAVALPRRNVTHKPAVEDEDTARSRVMLEAKQRAITELEGDRTRRLLDARGKLAELESQYTAVHPLIVDTQRTIASLTHESPQVSSLRGEVRELENELKRRTTEAEVGAILGSPSVGGSRPAAGSAEPLPTEIIGLGDDADLDPAVAAQFRYAVANYTRIRDDISAARIDLDTAQAAFSHRYKIVVPGEAPSKAAKPKVPLVIGAGIVGALFAALIAAILAELRAGKIIERWQVQQIELPVLAELRFPPASE